MNHSLPATVSGYVAMGGPPRWSDVLEDFQTAWRRRLLAVHLARRDVRLRLRFSRLGYGWLVITQAVAVAGIGVVYAQVMGLPMAEFVPYLACGFVTWSLISGLVSESPDALVQSGSYLGQSRLPLSLFALRVVTRNLIQFAVRFIVIIVAFAVFGHVPGAEALLAIPGLALIVAAGAAVVLTVGMLGARYRDIGPLFGAIMPLLFLLTPVIWMADRVVGLRSAVVLFNPFYHYLQVVRGPLLGHDELGLSFAVAGVLTLLWIIAALAAMRLVGRRIVLWL